MGEGGLDGTVAVTDLKQWVMCARVVWYEQCLPQVRPVTSLMEQGKRAHVAEVGREERRSLRTYGLEVGERVFDVDLYSVRLGLRGRVDLVIAVPDRVSVGAYAVVVDYKDSEGAPGAHVRLQLAAYALLVEEVWGLPVRELFSYALPLREAFRVPLTAALRRKVVTTVAAIQAAVAMERMPDAPSSRGLCGQCEFRRFCNDVV